jgi:hypothetical protein
MVSKESGISHPGIRPGTWRSRGRGRGAPCPQYVVAVAESAWPQQHLGKVAMRDSSGVGSCGGFWL